MGEGCNPAWGGMEKGLDGDENLMRGEGKKEWERDVWGVKGIGDML